MYCAIRFLFTRCYPKVTFNPIVWSDWLKGARHMCKKSNRKQYIWDPQQYVDWLDKQPVPEKMTVLSQETASVVALAAGLRVADLMNLGSEIEFTGNIARVPFLGVSKNGEYREDLEFTKLPGNQRTCVVTILKRYVEHTKMHYQLKGWPVQKQLLVSSTAPKPVEASTVRQYLLRELACAGIQDTMGVGYTPHSFRSAATSSAYFRGFSFDQITTFAGWKTESTFQKHYKRKLIKVLPSLLPPVTQGSYQEEEVYPGEYQEELRPEEDQADAQFDEEETLKYKSFCYTCCSVYCRSRDVCSLMLPPSDAILEMAKKL